MRLPQPMQRGRLIKRYKRFLADIELESGELITAHCANPGAMLGIDMPGLEVFVSLSGNPKRKLPYSLEIVMLPSGPVGANTSLPNRLVAEALAARHIPALAAYETVRPEVKYGEKSRVDFLLTAHGMPDCYLEVKNVHMMRSGGIAEFPDCVTARGVRHLGELGAMVAAGKRAINLFVVQRMDCSSFSPASDIDPAYAEALTKAQTAGVELLCYDCSVSRHQISLRAPLPISLR